MKENNDIQTLLQQGKQMLIQSGKSNAQQEATLLLQKASGLTKIQILTETTVTSQAAEQYDTWIQRRILGEPLQYILGEWEFMGLSFVVGEGVLIPRSDTEVLVETVLEMAKVHQLQTGLDIGTGTGCIAICLSKLGNLSMTAVDISEKALQYAIKNNEILKANVILLESDLFTSVQGKKFDCIVSNPPYIATAEIQTLMTEVRDHEPHSALDGGVTGLEFYERIIAQANEYLNDKGWIFFEIGCTQKQDLMTLLQKAGFVNIQYKTDLSGLDRVVFAQKGMKSCLTV